MNEEKEYIKEYLLGGGVVVLRTDTLYGIVARADKREAVEQVYALKKRNLAKPCIILVASVADIPFDQNTLIDIYTHEASPVSVVVPVSSEPLWLTRGGDSLAYRVPKDDSLKELLEITGPLIAPSANPEGLAPARNITEAKAYFGDQVVYFDTGPVAEHTEASRIVRVFLDGTKEWLR